MEKLFEPIKIRNMELKNRVVMPAMHTGLAKNGFITKRSIDFYEERARGEVGLIIIGGCYTEHLGRSLPNMISISEDKFIPGLVDMAEAVHRHHGKIAAQLYHAGRYAHSIVLGEQAVSASPVRSRFTGETPRELSLDEIKQTIENYAQAALRAKKANFDAAEILSGTGYLISQFLSPLTNKRKDKYGGDIYGRTTFLKEILARTRELVGDFPIIVRMAGDDFVEGSHTHEEQKVVASEIAKSGADIISVTGGWHETRVPQITMNLPRGVYVYLAEGIKKVVDIPVVACNRINDPQLAEKILFEGKCDLVAMGRAFIADPQILIKAKEGRFNDIRMCTACNQGCFDAVFSIQPITCLQNPMAAKEKEYEIKPAEKAKKVFIIGGGPAGMEAAWRAASRGHNVTLFEKDKKLGGQINLACVPPGREELSEVVKFRKNQLEKFGAILNLNQKFDENILIEEKPDVAILATGAKPLIPDIPGIQKKIVKTAFEILAGIEVNGQKIVVIGGGGIGCETALYLASLGKEVVLVEMLERFGVDLGRSTRWVILQDIRKMNLNMIPKAKVIEILDDGIMVEREGKREKIEADMAVLSVGTVEEKGLIEKLRSSLNEVYAIGDCVTPRKALEAIREGFEIGIKI